MNSIVTTPIGKLGFPKHQKYVKNSCNTELQVYVTPLIYNMRAMRRNKPVNVILSQKMKLITKVYFSNGQIAWSEKIKRETNADNCSQSNVNVRLPNKLCFFLTWWLQNFWWSSLGYYLLGNVQVCLNLFSRWRTL